MADDDNNPRTALVAQFKAEDSAASIKTACQYALLFIGKVYVQDVTFDWSTGGSQRPPNGKHINNLVEKFLQDGVPDREHSPERFIRVGVTRAAFRRFCEARLAEPGNELNIDVILQWVQDSKSTLDLRG